MSVFDQTKTTGMPRSTEPSRACPGCGGRDATRFYYLADQPVHVGVTYPTADDARHAPLAEIDLWYCRGCGLGYNTAFDPAKLNYAPGYDASLTASAQFMRFLDAIIDRLIQRYELPGKTVLEVGCGIGHFLRRICERAGCHGIGVDPALPAEGSEQVGEHTITWVRSAFGPEHAGLPCDLLCGLDMFEHLPEPLIFLRSIREVLPRAGGTPVYFESPNRDLVFDAEAGWGVYYEQCVHYDLPSIRGLFERSGFTVTHAGPCELNAQCLSVDAVARPAGEPPSDDTSHLTDALPANLAEYAQIQGQRIEDWRQRLAGWADAGREVVLWGSGGKGINFLNTVTGAETIRRVVDINPARQGRYLPRAAQQIVPPGALTENRPAVVLVSNRLWHDEIASTIKELGLDGELIDI